MNTDTQKEQLLDQQLALSAYLEALLYEAAPVKTELKTETGYTDESGSRQFAQISGDNQAEAATARTENGVPEWAQSRFQVLLFEVAGMTLAVPLVKLKGVVPNEQGLTPMPGHSPLFLGIVPYQGLQSKVVDTARFILPQDRIGQLSDDVAGRTGHLAMIDEGRWALACTRICDVIELERTDVKWRTANGKRVWLAGTVIDRMCALLDIDELTGQLVEGINLA